MGGFHCKTICTLVFELIRYLNLIYAAIVVCIIYVNDKPHATSATFIRSECISVLIPYRIVCLTSALINYNGESGSRYVKVLSLKILIESDTVNLVAKGIKSPRAGKDIVRISIAIVSYETMTELRLFDIIKDFLNLASIKYNA